MAEKKIPNITKRPLARFPLLLLLAVLAPGAARGELEVSADFPGGAAEILELDREARSLQIPAYRFTTYIRTEEERGRMSAGWARLRSDPARTVAVTLETSWNHPQGHAASYLEAGRRLGMAVARHIEEIE